MGNEDLFDLYFRRADLDGDGKISGAEAVAFFQMSNLPKHVLAQVWMYSDQKQAGFLGRAEFYNALKLVTVAQSKRELTPDTVKKALFGPAASHIPAPQINLPAMSSLLNHGATTAPTNLGGSTTPVGASGGKTTEHTSQFSTSQNNLMRPAGGMPARTLSQQQQFSFSSQELRSSENVADLRPHISNTSFDGYNGVETHTLTNAQVSNHMLSMPTPGAGFGMTVSGSTPIPPNLFSSSGLSTSARGNMYNSTSTPQVQKQNFPSPSHPLVSLSASSSVLPLSSDLKAVQHTMQHARHNNTSNDQKFSGNQLYQAPLTTNPGQALAPQTTLVTSSDFPARSAHSSTNQSHYPWQKISQTDVQKYTKVFLEVDKDRDGKITGEQAQKLFLSWRLPRAILKQVWDLADQDNDGMLSLKEFCIALYFMERYREGRSLPTTFPGGVFDETFFQKAVQPAVGHGDFSTASSAKPDDKSRPHDGLSGIPNKATSMPGHKPKHNIPVLEKHLLGQLSKEEQSSLESKFKEATVADKKVEELEKEILDSREKIEFYRTKMQELILYKSRCDNRFNETLERVSNDKSEVDLLSKKYEEKCKQVGDVASKLTIEEATFRDIQEQKMELYQAIAKMEQGGNSNNPLQEHTERIYLDLEGLMKALSERSKKYGLRAQPTTLLELPFGWQPAIQEGAADWDEDWDKFEDEGFTFIKELTLDVQNVIAPPKTKSSIQKGTSMEDTSFAASLIGDKDESENTVDNNGSRTPIGSPTDRNGERGYSHESQDLKSVRNGSADGSSRRIDNQNDNDVGPVRSGEKDTEDSEWGKYGTHFTRGFKDSNVQGSDHNAFEDSFFDSSGFALDPIKTTSLDMEGISVRKKSPLNIPDSIPSTPVFDSGNSPVAHSEASEEHSFGNFPRFDSFSTQDGGFFQPHDSFARFDSIRSSADSEFGHGFGSFDDLFGTSGPFKPASESTTPKSESGTWSAF